MARGAAPTQALRQFTRRRVLQLLYSLEYNRLPYQEGEDRFLGASARRRRNWDEFAHRLGQLTYEKREELDIEIAAVLVKWSIQRLALTDKLCLRMALAEFKFFPEIPIRVTMDEYIELARHFGTDQSPAYVNGILDRLAKNYPEKDFQAEKPTKPRERKTD